MEKGLIRVFLGLWLFAACGKKGIDNKCITYRQGYAVAVSGKDSGKINEDIKLNVSFAVMNGCGQFERFEEITMANLTKITIVAKHAGCFCTDDIPIRKTEYIFRSTKAGTYHMQFSGYDFDILDTLVIR